MILNVTVEQILHCWILTALTLLGRRVFPAVNPPSQLFGFVARILRFVSWEIADGVTALDTVQAIVQEEGTTSMRLVFRGRVDADAEAGDRILAAIP